VEVLDRVVGQPAPDRRDNISHGVKPSRPGARWSALEELRKSRKQLVYDQTANVRDKSASEYYPVHLLF
jgi:hypothetical protein